MIIQIESKNSNQTKINLSYVKVLKTFILIMNKIEPSEKVMLEYFTEKEENNHELVFIPDSELLSGQTSLNQEVKMFITSLKIKGRLKENLIENPLFFEFFNLFLYPIDGAKYFNKESSSKLIINNINNDYYLVKHSVSFFKKDFVRKVFQKYIFNTEKYYNENFYNFDKSYRKTLIQFIRKKDKDIF